MHIVERKGDSWPGIGLVLGAAFGTAIGAMLMPAAGDNALFVSAGVGVVLGLLGGSLAATWARRREP